jgi:calcineurin-like phosphoesterase family protein
VSNTVYVIADLHLGHRKVAESRGFATIQEHDDAIVKAWNASVFKKDVVYVLGDVFTLDRVAELAGTKKLAMGNHDSKPVAAYLALFSQVRACFEYDNCLLTHIPVHPSQRSRYRLNVHGHTHAAWIDDPWYVPVSVEHCQGMQPLPLVALVNRNTLPT